jgi:hypothetical protein
VFVIVRIRAIPERHESAQGTSRIDHCHDRAREALTNETQPDHTDQPHNSQNGQSNPQSRCQVQAQPEETLVRGADCADIGVRGFKDPVRVAGSCVDFIPPPKTNKSTSSNVLEVIEVGREEEKGQDKDQNAK